MSLRPSGPSMCSALELLAFASSELEQTDPEAVRTKPENSGRLLWPPDLQTEGHAASRRRPYNQLASRVQRLLREDGAQTVTSASAEADATSAKRETQAQDAHTLAVTRFTVLQATPRAT